MRLSRSLCGVFAIATTAAAQTFSLHIENPPGQSQFRIGEAIGLWLVFEMSSASNAPPPGRPGWMVTLIGHDRSPLGFGRDRFVVAPETGTRDPWNYRLHGGITYSGPEDQAVNLESNQVDIDIIAADPQWQAQELGDDVAILNSTLSKIDSQAFEARMSAARRITYLDTPAAVREMARWLG